MSIKLKGSTDGSVTLQAPADTSPTGTDKTFTLPTQDGTAEQVLKTDGSGNLSFADNVSSGRNLIINGAMQVAQRGTSSTGQTTTGYKTVDRFRVVMSSGGTYTVNQSTDAPDGFSNSLHLDNTATATPGAASLLTVDYAIEGSDVQRLDYGTSGAKSLTLSFYVKSDVSGTYTVELFTNDGDSFIGKTYSISAGEVGTWVRRELTFTGNTATSIANDNTRGLTVVFWLVAGSNYTGGTFNDGSWDTTVANRVDSNQVNLSSSTDNDWYITGVQLEVGDVATKFEHRSYGDELARCQRYFQKYREPRLRGVGGGSTHLNRLGMTLPVTMRQAPTVTSTNTFAWYDGTGTGSINTFTATYNFPDSIELDSSNSVSVPNAMTGTTATSRGLVVYNSNGAHSGEILLNAEL